MAPATGWPALKWALRGEMRQPKGGKAQTWLHLTASGQVALTCQRCLKPVHEDIDIDRWIRFVDTEAEAAALDVDSDDDVLALPRDGLKRRFGREVEMGVVFAVFLSSQVVLIKTLALGTTVAILLDATLVRLVLVPAVMMLAGRLNWWLPRRIAAFSKRFDLGHD